MGPEGNGSLNLLLLFSTVVGLIINFGIGQASVFYIGINYDQPKKVISNLFTLTWIIGILSIVILLFFLPLYRDKLFNTIPSLNYILIIIITPFVLGKIYAEYIFTAIQNFFWSNSINLIDVGLRLITLIILLTFGLDLFKAVCIVVVCSVISFGIGWIKIFNTVGDFRITLQKELIKRYTTYGLSSYISVLATFLTLRLDQFLVGYFLTLERLGVYIVAVIVAELPMKIANAITKVLFATVSSLDEKKATDLTNKTIKVVVFFAILIALGLLLIGSFIIKLCFGSKFIDATTALWLLLPGAIAFNFIQILYSDLSGRGKPSVGILTSLISLTITVIGNIILTPKLGINGAAITSSISYLIAGAVILKIYLNITNQSFKKMFKTTKKEIFDVINLFKN